MISTNLTTRDLRRRNRLAIFRHLYTNGDILPWFSMAQSAAADGKYCLPTIIQAVGQYALKRPFQNTRIRVSQQKHDAGSLGAARLALDAFLANHL